MALKDLVTDLSNFRYTDYDNAGANQSQIEGRFGGTTGPTPAQPPLSDEHTKFDDGVGRGAMPNDDPQTFNVRGYTVTGNKRFYIGYQGDIIPNDESVYGIGPFNSIAGVFDHTQIRDRLRKTYTNYGNNEFSTDGSIHIGSQDTAGVVGGGVDYYGSLVTISPRGSLYRDSSGNYQVPQDGRNTNPPGGISNIPEFTKTQITFNIPQHTSTGPTQFTIQPLNTTSLIPDLHDSDFMTRPSYTSQIGTDTATHNVSMITLTGPTTQDYQTTINLDKIAEGAHGSDFQTTPIEAFSSRFATTDGLLMDTVHISGFNRGDMYMQNAPEPTIPEFKVFTQSDKSLKPFSEWSPQKYGSNFVDTIYTFFGGEQKEYRFDDRLPYNIPARDDSAVGFDQPFILRPIGNTWGFDKPNGDGFFSKVGGFLNEIDSAVGDITRGAPGFTGLVSRTLHDAVRLGKFALTTKGIFFVAKQYGLQLLNPRPETRVYNPLSLGSIAPIVHMDRHLDGGTYEDALGSGGEESILTGYGNALTDPKTALQGGKIAFQTARRVTLAHVTAMVPGAGGKVSFGALPEIGFDLTAGGSGNINAFSRNIVGIDKYNRNKRYTTTDGTPIIPARNPEAGYKSGILASRYAGSPLTEMFITEEGIRQAGTNVGYPSAAITDAVIKPEIFEGNSDDIDSPYFGNSNTNSNFGVDKDTNKVEVLRNVNFVNIGNPLNPIHNRLTPTDKVGQLDFTQQLIYNPLSENYPSELRLAKEGVYTGDLYDRSNAYAPIEIPDKIQDKLGVLSTREERLQKGTIQLGDFAIYKKRYFHSFSGQGPVVSIGGRDTLSLNGYMIENSKTRIRIKRGRRWRSDLYDKDNTYSLESRLTINDDSEPQLEFSLPYNNLDSPTTAKNIRSLSVNLTTRTGEIRNKKVQLSDYKDFTWSTTHLVGTSVEGMKFVGNKYGPAGSKRYGNISYSDSKGYWGKIPGTGDGDPETGVYDWSDLDVGDSVGGLTMVSKTEQVPDKRNVRSEPTKKGTQAGLIQPKQVEVNRPPDGSQFENLKVDIDGEKQEIPTVVKTKITQDDNAPPGIEQNPDVAINDKPAVISVPATSVTKKSNNEDIQDSPTGTKEALKRYKTLSYGDLGEGSAKRYNQQWLSGGETDEEDSRRKALFEKISEERKSENKLVYRLGNPGQPGVMAVYDEQLMGKIKPAAMADDKVTSYNGDLQDKINMTPYGEDSAQPDFVKFKFYDMVNQKYIIFRATLSGISETLSPEWSSERYIGRPDNVHVYQGVDRALSFNFIVAPTSRQELPILWEKLNYLVGLTYPHWNPQSAGGKRMESPFINLTIGDMYNEVPGYLSGLSVEVEDQSTWEITDGFQLPKVINVSCEFAHIGQHPLASQGIHYDFGGKDKTWLKPYSTETGEMGDRPDKWNDFYSKIGAANE